MSDSAKELKAEIDRLCAKLAQAEEHLNDLVMRVPFEGTNDMAFRRVSGGQFRIFFQNKPVSNQSATNKITAARILDDFLDEYYGHLQNMLSQAKDIPS